MRRTAALSALLLLVACGGSPVMHADLGGGTGVGPGANPPGGGRDGGSTVGGSDGATATLDGATDGGPSTVDDAGPSPEQQCEAFTDCSSCQAVASCFWCNSYGGACHTRDVDHVFACDDPGCGGSSSCDPNGTYVGPSGADSCCSMTVDASGECTAAPPGPGACRSDGDCGAGEFCSYSSGEAVGTCTPNTPGCSSQSCVIDSDCGTYNGLPLVCDQGCCYYAG